MNIRKHFLSVLFFLFIISCEQKYQNSEVSDHFQANLKRTGNGGQINLI